MDLAFMVSPTAVHTVREHLAKPFDRLALPCAHLVRMNLVLRGSVRSPRSASSATFAFKSPENLRLLFIAYPSLVGGIHLKQLSDFPGPPQLTPAHGVQ